MFENIGENLSAMISIPTVSGAGNEPFYHIEEYRNYLRTTFQTLFTAADITPVGEALLIKLGEPAAVSFMRRNSRHPSSRIIHRTHGRGSRRGRSLLEVSSVFRPDRGRLRLGKRSQDMKDLNARYYLLFESLLEEGWRPKRDIWLYLPVMKKQAALPQAGPQSC